MECNETQGIWIPGQFGKGPEKIFLLPSAQSGMVSINLDQNRLPAINRCIREHWEVSSGTATHHQSINDD